MKIGITEGQLSIISNWLTSNTNHKDFDYLTEELNSYILGEDSIIDEMITLPLFNEDDRDSKSLLKKSYKQKNQSAINIIADVLDKYDGRDVYLSFRKHQTQTLINPKNAYSTPTGLYCYPLVPLLSNVGISWKTIRDIDPSKFFSADIFPFVSNSEFFLLFHVSNTDRVFYSDYDKDTMSIVKQILSDFPEAVEDSQKISDYVNTGSIKVGNGLVTGTEALWEFIFELHKVVSVLANYRQYSNKANYFFTTICNKYNIHGFVDDLGTGFIHANEPIQAVFFHKLKNITDYNNMVSKLKGMVFRPSDQKTYSQLDFRRDELETSIKFTEKLEKYLSVTHNLPYLTLAGSYILRNIATSGLYFFGIYSRSWDRKMVAFKMDPSTRSFIMVNDMDSIKDIDTSKYDLKYQEELLTLLLTYIGYDGMKMSDESGGAIKKIPDVEDPTLKDYFLLRFEEISGENYPIFLNMLGKPYKGKYNRETGKRLSDSASGPYLSSAYLNSLYNKKFTVAFISYDKITAYNYNNNQVVYNIVGDKLVKQQ